MDDSMEKIERVPLLEGAYARRGGRTRPGRPVPVHLAFRSIKRRPYDHRAGLSPGRYDPYARRWSSCFSDASARHVEQDSLQIRSSAVAWGSSGSLILEESGLEKSPVVRRSAALGLDSLGDDLNFLTKGKK